MSELQRISLRIDVFEKVGQKAMILPNLMPPELIRAILTKFGSSLAYLADDPALYQLVKASDSDLLQDTLSVLQQVGPDGHLRIEERRPALPIGTQRPSHALVLRDLASGAVYPIHWVPAVIGRPDTQQPEPRLAVSLERHPLGLRVSRRHATIVEEGGVLLIESQIQNPTLVRPVQGQQQLLGNTRRPLKSGDIIILQTSQIELQVFIRE